MNTVARKAPLPNVIDLFSGAGGLSLGAARAGFSVRGAVELDAYASAAHRLNFPNTIHVDSDVSRLSGSSVRSLFNLANGDLAGIIGGPPCQGFSCIGRNKKNDARNKLFKQFFRIVAEARPKFFLAENVPGILNKRNAVLRDRAFAHVEGEYILLPPMIISAEKYGAATERRRVFFFGYLADQIQALTPSDFQPPPHVEIVRVHDALRGLPTKINPKWQEESQGWRVVRVYGTGFFCSRLHGHVPAGVGSAHAIERLKKEGRASGCLGTVHSKKVARRYASLQPGKRDAVSKSHRLDPDGFCPTLRAGTGSDRGRFQAVRPLHPTENRVITPREAARLQGFPDWFQFSASKWHSFRQIGSSVSPIVAEHLLDVIRKALDDNL